MAVGQGHGHGCDFIMEFPWVTLNYGNPLSRKHSRVDYGLKFRTNAIFLHYMYICNLLYYKLADHVE